MNIRQTGIKQRFKWLFIAQNTTMTDGYSVKIRFDFVM